MSLLDESTSQLHAEIVLAAAATVSIVAASADGTHYIRTAGRNELVKVEPPSGLAGCCAGRLDRSGGLWPASLSGAGCDIAKLGKVERLRRSAEAKPEESATGASRG